MSRKTHFSAEELSAFLKTIKQIESISLYPIHILYDDTLIYPEVSDRSTDPFTSDAELINACRTSSNFTYDNVNKNIFYCSMKLSSDLFCIVGPLSFIALDTASLHRYMHDHHMKGFYNYPIPQATVVQAFNALDLLDKLSLCHGFEPSGTLLTPPSLAGLGAFHMEPTEHEQYQAQQYALNATEINRPHFSYAIEAQILEALKNGDINRFNHFISEVFKYSIGSFAKSNLKMSEYSVVSIVSVFTRTVIQAGVSAAEAYATSDRILYKLSLLKSEEEINEFMNEVFSTYINLVKRYQQANAGSVYTRKCKEYIMHHLNSPLSPDILAEKTGISTDYLTHIFKKEEGCSIMSFVQKERINAASNMLKYSDYDIMRIANYFQFQTQSHFSVVFKKYTGMTPAAFRRENTWT